MDIARIRRWFADELRYTVPVRSESVIEAFATVPREAFVEPGPWTLRTELGRVRTPDADPSHLYHDVLIPLDEEKDLNNGSPKLWAELFDVLSVGCGERIVHIGGGRGYYTAILAELAGPTSRLTSIEIEPRLARCAREALAPWPQVEVIEGNAFDSELKDCDVIVLSAGVSHFPIAWVDALLPNGRLMLPLTVDGEWPLPGNSAETWKGGWGQILLVTRRANGFSAKFVRPCGFTNCVGGHDADVDKRLREAYARGDAKLVRSLRNGAEPRDDTCWFEGGGWWLSLRSGEMEH